MRRLDIFIVTLTVAVTVLVILAIVGWYYASTAQSSWIAQMWSEMGGSGGEGGMMGNGGSYAAASPYLWVLPVTLIAIAITAVLGVAFYLVYPELKYIRGKPCAPQNVGITSNLTNNGTPKTSTVNDTAANDVVSSNSCEVLLKTMTPEEQKVINVLIKHQGKYLQKYVVKEAELSRLKTHRIIARFAQRGIVIVKEFGNTNEIQLSKWVTDGKSSLN